jgi:hypothetical protein
MNSVFTVCFYITFLFFALCIHVYVVGIPVSLKFILTTVITPPGAKNGIYATDAVFLLYFGQIFWHSRQF